MRKIPIILFFILLTVLPSYATVIYNMNFDSEPDWSAAQQLLGSNTYQCSTGCSIGNGETGLPSTNWQGIYNGPSWCDGNSIRNAGGPGNNTMSIGTGVKGSVAGVVDATGCYGGSGKCLTFWDEVCMYESGDSEDSDGQLVINLGAYYKEIYLSWKVKFKPSFGWMSSDSPNLAMHKFFHIQWWDLSSPIFSYHSSNGSIGTTDPFITGIFEYYYGGDAMKMGIISQCSNGSNDTCNGTPAFQCDNCPDSYPTDSTVIGSLRGAYEHGTVPNLRDAGQLFDGNWHTITIYVKMNTAIGQRDGKFKTWIDGTEVYNSSNHSYYYCSSSNGGCSTTNHDIPFVQNGGHSSALNGWRLVTIGGNNGNRYKTLKSCTGTGCEQWYVVDNIKIATTYEEATGGGESDITAPAVTVSTTDPSTIGSNALTVTGTASDAVGVSSCKYRVGLAPDAGNGTACTGTTSWSCLTTGYSAGANTLYVGCTDAAGNWGSDSMVVNYPPPSISGCTISGISR